MAADCRAVENTPSIIVTHSAPLGQLFELAFACADVLY
jgi:hypothetical protein